MVAFPGEAVAHENFHHLIQDLVLLHSLGIQLVLVHGARHQIDQRLIADNLPGEYGLGIAQRIQVGGMSAYLVVLGCALKLGACLSPRPN